MPRFSGSSDLSGKSTTRIVAGVGSVSTASADYVCDGTNDEVQIAQALADLPSGGGRVTIIEGTYQISAALTVPATDEIEFLDGAVLSINVGGSVTYNGIINAGEHQIFNINGGTLTINNRQNVKVSWFGWILGTNDAPSRAANVTSFNNAVTSLNNSTGKITFPKGRAYLNSGAITLPLTYSLVFEGAAPVGYSIINGGDTEMADLSWLGFIGAGTSIDAAANAPRGVHFKDLIIGYGSTTVDVGVPPTTILLIGNDGDIENCFVFGATTACVQDGAALINYVIRRCMIGRTSLLQNINAAYLGGDGLRFTENYDHTTVRVEDSYIHLCETRGLNLRGGRNFHFVNCIFESNEEEGILIYLPDPSSANSFNIKFTQCWVEDNQRFKAAGTNYQIVLNAQTLSYGGGFKQVVFDSCYLNPVNSANRLLLNLNCALSPVFRNCFGFGYAAGVVNTEVAIGTNLRGALFDGCELVHGSRTYITSAGVGRVQVIHNGYPDNGYLISDFDPVNSPGSKVSPFIFSAANPGAGTNDLMQLVPDTTATTIRVPYAGSIIAISAVSNAAVAGGTITFEVEAGAFGAPAATGFTVVLDVGEVRDIATQGMDTDTIPAGGDLRIRWTTAAGYSSTTNDYVVYVWVAM